MKLDALSKKIGIDLGYFLPRVLWIGGRYFATTALGLLVSVAFARLSAKETFGQYQYILSIVSLLSIFSLPGLNTAALRAFVEGDEQAIERSVRISFFGSLIASTLIIGLGAYNYYQAHTTLAWALFVAAVFQPFFYAPNNWYVYYEGKLDFHSSTIRIVCTNIALLIGVIGGLQAGFNLVGLIALYFGLNAIITSGLYIEGKRKTKPKPTQNKLSLSYAFRCTIQKFTTTIGENLQTVVVTAVFGFASLAIFQVAQSFVNAFNGLTAALSATYFPLLLKYKKLNHLLIIMQNLVLGIGFWLVYLFAIKFLFTPLYGAQYQDSVVLAERLSYVIFLVPLRLYLTNFFSAKDRNGYIIASNLVASALALSLFFVKGDNGFFTAAVTYFYTLNILMVAPLLLIYITTTLTSPTAYSSKADATQN